MLKIKGHNVRLSTKKFVSHYEDQMVYYLWTQPSYFVSHETHK